MMEATCAAEAVKSTYRFLDYGVTSRKIPCRHSDPILYIIPSCLSLLAHFRTLISLKALNLAFFRVALRPNTGYELLFHEVSRSYKTTHHSR